MKAKITSKPSPKPKPVDVHRSLKLSRKIPAKMKPAIEKLLTSESQYRNGRVFRLKMPPGMGKISSKIKGVSLGADSKGFFVYTHRCRSKSSPNPLKITKREIDFIESTG